MITVFFDHQGPLLKNTLEELCFQFDVEVQHVHNYFTSTLQNFERHPVLDTSTGCTSHCLQ